MHHIKKMGLFIFLIALGIFTAIPFIGSYEIAEDQFNSLVNSKGFKSELFIDGVQENVIGKEFNSAIEISNQIVSLLSSANETHKANSEWDKVIWDKPHNLVYELVKPAGKGLVVENKSI